MEALITTGSDTPGPGSPRLRISTVILFLAGAFALVAVVLLANTTAVVRMLLAAGLWLIPIAALHPVEYALKTASWGTLLSAQGVRRPFHELFALRWLSDSVDSLLPVAGIGGAFVRADLQAAQGLDGAVASAVIVVEMTVRLFTLVGFIALGVALLVLEEGAPATGLEAAGAGLVAALGVFLIVQRSGLLLRLARKVEEATERDTLLRFSGGLARMDACFADIYQKRGPLGVSAFWSFLAWAYGAVEIGLILYVTGHALGPAALLAMESVGQAAANAGFMIPGGMGAEEGGYLLGARLVGLAAATGVAVSLVKRVREVILGVPALVAWRFMARRHRSDAPHS